MILLTPLLPPSSHTFSYPPHTPSNTPSRTLLTHLLLLLVNPHLPTRFCRVGSSILLLHDSSDVFLESAKVRTTIKLPHPTPSLAEIISLFFLHPSYNPSPHTTPPFKLPHPSYYPIPAPLTTSPCRLSHTTFFSCPLPRITPLFLLFFRCSIILPKPKAVDGQNSVVTSPLHASH